MSPFYIPSSSQRRSYIRQFPEAANTEKSHAARPPFRPTNTVNNEFGQSYKPEKPLEGWGIAGTVLACLIGAGILAWIIHYCWKHCGPRPTYYERAVRINKKHAVYQGREMGLCSQYSSCQITPTCTLDPVVTIDNLARPDAARTRSSSCYSQE
ncbi:hypothetical protein GGR58DRAFT_520944 [Xylaria digitata]|nr:hypothetical protein GGR58DRAFT_520944 [Xylaria digitata]